MVNEKKNVSSSNLTKEERKKQDKFVKVLAALIQKYGKQLKSV